MSSTAYSRKSSSVSSSPPSMPPISASGVSQISSSSWWYFRSSFRGAIASSEIRSSLRASLTLPLSRSDTIWSWFWRRAMSFPTLWGSSAGKLLGLVRVDRIPGRFVLIPGTDGRSQMVPSWTMPSLSPSQAFGSKGSLIERPILRMPPPMPPPRPPGASLRPRRLAFVRITSIGSGLSLAMYPPCSRVSRSLRMITSLTARRAFPYPMAVSDISSLRIPFSI